MSRLSSLKPGFEVHFGGPDQPYGNLRNLLIRLVTGTPAGGSIDWVTYYFRDRELASALIDARQRGVDVRLTLSGKPRTSFANDVVIGMLRGADGLMDGLNLVSIPGAPAPRGRAWKPQLHEKLYCFSHPEPIAYIGSFNPAGDEPEERPDIVEEIGDHNRSHNALIGIKERVVVDKLREHARQLHRKSPNLFYRFSRRASADISAGNMSVWFWPRISSHPVLSFLKQFGADARVRIAASHIKSRTGIRAIIGLAGRGANVEIVADSTCRRVSELAEKRFVSSGVKFRRLQNAEHILMHLKFILLGAGNKRWSIFGSFNWTNPSFWLNHEIAAISDDPGLFRLLDERWRALTDQPEL